ncbi:glycosyltransferase [Peribacillus frigoritolerans]|uniref:glycosyltransferase n=1 Tax=Peribacillus frigoritolerans TaxID=450367 RepID=UPI0010709D48|nr:glycosyltransferase [Peribacillus frigoritolerans]TFH63646.1 glycosyltransferase [Peribacillus frigoritolerans]
MKNILLLCEAYGGGVKTYIDAITLNEERFPKCQFNVLVSSKRNETGSKINRDFIIDDNLSFGKSPLKLIRAINKIHRLVKKNNINIIHANSTFSGLLIYIYSFFNRRITFIYTPHGYYSLKSMNKFKKKFIRFVEKKINNVSHNVIHVSNSEENEAIKHQIVSKEKSKVIFNGVEDPDIDIKKNLKDTFKIVNLARVDDQKNPFEFIEIAKQIIDAGVNVEFIWAGNGEFLEEARKKVKEYNMEKKIRFIGFSDQKNDLLSQADLYFSTSYYEGLPFSVVEAMSYKIPLILSDIVGHSDLVDQEKNGILFELKDRTSVIHFIQSMISDREKWNYLSSNSYECYKKHFSLDIMLQSLSEVYQNKVR